MNPISAQLSWLLLLLPVLSTTLWLQFRSTQALKTLPSYGHHGTRLRGRPIVKFTRTMNTTGWCECVRSNTLERR
jgi:hypothetical protein